MNHVNENTHATSPDEQIHLDVVFVHLRTKLPKYILNNLKRIKRENPQLRLTLISDVQSNLELARQIKVGAVKYKADPELAELLERHFYNAEFRNGFWQTSISRLFASLEIVIQSNMPMLHLESDILTTEDFPWEKFAEIQKTTWLQFNSSRDVAAIFSCPNADEAKWLRMEMLKYLSLDSHATDMTLLNEVSSNNQERIVLLPIAPGVNSAVISEGTPRESKERNSIYFEYFNGIFDGATIGMWLSGQDPRNNLGLLKRHILLGDSFINARNIQIRQRKNGLDLIEEENKIKLFNLHLHSKINWDFSHFSGLRMKLNIFLNRFDREIVTLAPFKFIEVFKDIYKRHGKNKVMLFHFMKSKILK